MAKFYDAQKERTISTAKAVVEKLQGVKEEELLSTLFVIETDEVLKKVNREIEYVLLQAVSNKEEFISNLHTNMRRIADYIINEKAYRKFYVYCRKMYQKLIKERTNISDAYYDMLIQIGTYFCHVDKNVVGVDSNGEVVAIDQICPGADTIMYEVELKANRNGWGIEKIDREVRRALRNKGMNVGSVIDVNELFMRERVINNMWFNMTSFVDSKDSELLRKPYLSIRLGNINWGGLVHFTRELVKEVNSRRRLLPKQGVLLVDEDSKCSVQELYIQEKYEEDKAFLVYRIMINGSNMMGYYDIEDDFFYSVFVNSDEADVRVLNKKLKNYVLERYAALVTDIDKAVSMTVKTTSKGGTKKHKIDRSSMEKIYTDIEAFVRKLPVGSKASDEAKELARKYHIMLKDDETFVRPFTKRVNRKKKGSEETE